jgi:hypothetical protein
MNPRHRAACLLLGVLLAACVAPGSSGPPSGPGDGSSTSEPSTALASPSPLPDLSPSPDPSASPIPSPSPGPSPSPAVAPNDVLVARIFVYPDVTVGRVPPTLSVYADGRVISPSSNADGGFALALVVRRLTPAGLASLRSRLEASGFFTRDIEIPPVEAVNSGFTTYAVSLRVGDRLATAQATNAAMSPKGRALVDLAMLWTHPERALPADAWLAGPVPYEAPRWYLALRLQPGGVASTGVDSTGLEAAIGDPASFGSQLRSFDDGSALRCASVDAAVVTRIVASLTAAGLDFPVDADQYLVDLAWAGDTGSILLDAFPMWPDDPEACPADLVL